MSFLQDCFSGEVKYVAIGADLKLQKYGIMARTFNFALFAV